MSVSAAAAPQHVFQTNDHLSVDIGWEAPQAQARRGEGSGGKEIGMFAEEEPSFWDLLDVVNPLQHIPLVNTLYRELTGDQIGMAARLAGGTLFGGPIGFAAAAVNSAIEQDTGKDIGGHVLALFSDDDAPEPDAGTGVAVAAGAPEPPAETRAQEPVRVAAADPEPEAAATMPAPAPAMPVRGAMMFTAEGPLAPPAAARPAAPMPLAAEPARFFPVPPRAPGVSGRESPPPVSVPISNSGSRSNVPITGRDPVSGVAASPVAVQKALADQGHPPDVRHPMVPENASAEWFGSAMKSGLDKYEQAARLGRRGEPRETVPLQ